MTRKNQKAVPAPTEAAPDAVPVAFLPNPVATLLSTPQTRAEIALRDAVRSRLLAVESSIIKFVVEKQAKEFDVAEIDQLYAIELPIAVAHHFDGGRIRVRYDAQTVERAS